MSLESWPLITTVISGTAGIASFEPQVFVGTILPFIIGFVLGNLDSEQRNFFQCGTDVDPFLCLHAEQYQQSGGDCPYRVVGHSHGFVGDSDYEYPLILVNRLIGGGTKPPERRWQLRRLLPVCPAICVYCAGGQFRPGGQCRVVFHSNFDEGNVYGITLTVALFTFHLHVLGILAADQLIAYAVNNEGGDERPGFRLQETGIKPIPHVPLCHAVLPAAFGEADCHLFTRPFGVAAAKQRLQQTVIKHIAVFTDRRGPGRVGIQPQPKVRDRCSVDFSEGLETAGAAVQIGGGRTSSSRRRA